MFEEPTETTEKNQSKWPIVGAAILLILLLAGAAFVGGQLLASSDLEASAPEDSGAGPSLSTKGGGEGEMRMAVQVTPAAEAPVESPDAVGIFARRSDDNIIIGTGNITVQSNIDPEVPPEFSYDGIEIEVVITNQTKLYEDSTELSPGQTTVQEQIQEISNLDNLTEGASMQVWGERNGDRIVADTIIVRK